MTRRLFTPLQFRSPAAENALTSRNRVLVAPMCMYSVYDFDGAPTDFHVQHYGALAAGGAGLVLVEATAVLPEGRISPADLGLWECENSEDTEALVAAHRRVVERIHAHGALAGIQLAHAGAKASTWPPYLEGKSGYQPVADGGWQTVAPSALQLAPELGVPEALDREGIGKRVAAFGAAARLAADAGYDLVQLHGAHGYLIHEFLSPLTNKRDDEYGGSAAGRARFAHEVARAVRDNFAGVVGVRLSGTDWNPDGVQVADLSQLCRELADEVTLAWVDVSSAGIPGSGDIPIGPGYQVPVAKEIAAALSDTPVVVTAVGLITDPAQAEHILDDENLAGVSLGRELLRTPTWPLHAARALGVEIDADVIPHQYARAWQ